MTGFGVSSYGIWSVTAAIMQLDGVPAGVAAPGLLQLSI